ncbi:MAG TPA: hypothetical protein VGF94_15000 [Kofleriaceae bacterium]|jgi:hypothetical protein
MRLAIAALAACLGCTSQYFPRTPNHVAMTVQDGKLVYVRDGRTFEPGLGGGLVEAVQGNPSAVAAAQEFRSRQINGLVGMLLGAGGIVGGAAWGAGLAIEQQDNRNLHPNYIGPIALVVAGTVGYLLGAADLISAQPYQWDAINLFNDGAGGSFAPPPSLPLAPPAAPGYRADASLRMRP